MVSGESSDDEATPTGQSDVSESERNGFASVTRNKSALREECRTENIWSVQSTSPSSFRSTATDNYYSPATSRSDSNYFNCSDAANDCACNGKEIRNAFDRNGPMRICSSEEDDDGSNSNCTEREIASSEYSETNLLVENMKNRECEMFRRICYNNGYYTTSGSDTKSANESEPCCSCGLACERRLKIRRSLPPTFANYHTALHSPNLLASKSKQTNQRKNRYSNDRNPAIDISNTKTQKVTIIIRTKNSENTVKRNPISRNSEDIVLKKNNSYSSGLAEQSFGNFYSVDHSDCDETTSYLSAKSDSKSTSEQSQCFDCVEDSDEIDKEPRSGSAGRYSSKRSPPSNVQKKPEQFQAERMLKANNKKELSGMIRIVQEITCDSTVTSHVEVDREKLNKFKNRKQRQPTIIDDSFSEDILREANKLVSKVAADSLRSKCDTNPTQASERIHEKTKFISSDFRQIEIGNSPRSTGKSIGRLLHEQRGLTNLRTLVIERIATDILIAEEKHAQRLKKLEELPPIKPPRSFVASSSSSPLSKQSVDSSATIPIENVEYNPRPMGFIVPPSAPSASVASKNSLIGERTHIGWVNAECNDRKLFENPQEKAMHRHGSNDDIPLKEDIDTVDFSTIARQDFEDFSANLDENCHASLSTPIKGKPNKSAPTRSSGNNIIHASSAAEAARCLKCQGTVKRKSANFLTAKNGKKIGKAALKHTKTFINSSKRLLKKKRKSYKCERCSRCCCERDEFEIERNRGNEGDETVRMNSEIYCALKKNKCTDKSLNLTPKIINTAEPIALNPSPERVARCVNEKKQAAGKDKSAQRHIADENNDSSGAYVSPFTSFNFNRTVDSPKKPQGKSNSGEASPSKLITKLNQIAKSSKTLFRVGQAARSFNEFDTKHYYRSYGRNEMDSKVPLMSEMLKSLRTKLEYDGVDEERRTTSARKSLFRTSTPPPDNGAMLDTSIISKETQIELHEEPFYAEVKQQPAFAESKVDRDVVDSPAKIQEVLIENNRYLMINDDPKILYATVNRRKFSLSSSDSSLNVSSIGDFADSLKKIIDEQRAAAEEIYSNDREAECARQEAESSKSLSSGCSSFYQRHRQLAHPKEAKRWQDFMDSLSLCTVDTGSYHDSETPAKSIREAAECIDTNQSLPLSDEISFGSKEERNRYEELLISSSGYIREEDDSFLVSIFQIHEH